jgi:hypothetical protein
LPPRAPTYSRSVLTRKSYCLSMRETAL